MGLGGFEPPTTRTPIVHHTKLDHSPVDSLGCERGVYNVKGGISVHADTKSAINTAKSDIAKSVITTLAKLVITTPRRLFRQII